MRAEHIPLRGLRSAGARRGCARDGPYTGRVRLRLAPLNPTIGDLEGNAALIARAIDDARADRADLVLFPELCVCGYPPRDLLLQEGFVPACVRRVTDLASRAKGITVVLGSPWLDADAQGTPGARVGAPLPFNSLLALRDGAILARHDKRLLPTYDVFDEDRYFRAGDSPCVIDVAGVRVGLSVCEDLWRGADAGVLARYAHRADPVEGLVREGAQLILNASASPFVLRKGVAQRAILTEHVRRHGVALAAVNQLGGNDELIFDGRASLFVPDRAAASGAKLVALGKGFADTPATIDLPGAPSAWGALPGVRDPLDDTGDLWDALVLGARDYCRKTGFSSAVLGLSGGIDSAVVCCIAAAALGPERVLAVAMPSRYSSPGSVADAQALAGALGVTLVRAPIEQAHAAYESLLRESFAATPSSSAQSEGVTWENLQSRIRGAILMAFSNRNGAILLTTGNKSELAVGYCTIYGDMNGGLAILADVTKANVYRLARWINAHPERLELSTSGRAVIPEATISKPPSAELRPDQTDQDTLPPYDVVDEIVERSVEGRQSPSTIARESGIDAPTIARVLRLIEVSEFKRRQAAPGLKVTSVAFGTGRRWPIAQRWRP